MVKHLVDQLTPREVDVVCLMAEGLMNKEIEAQLYLSKNSVRANIRRIYAKLQISDDLLPRDKRQAAINRGKALGYIQDKQPPIKHNLPADTTRFIGREQELQDLTLLITDPHTRHITLLAPGGMGKSRLALAVARQLTQEGLPATTIFLNGVFFVPLAPLSNPANIISAIAEHTGYQFQSDGRNPKQQVLDYLCQKQMLLILDNFEHLLAGANIVSEILQAAPDVQILVTSRERLKLRGEKVYQVGGMTTPNNVEDSMMDTDAIQLFLHSAQLAVNEFSLQPNDLPHLNRICTLTEGMPLALVLAAAWVSMMSLEDIASEMQQSINFLAAEMGDIPRRHWSIKAVFEPTWKRLTQDEKSVFMKFSVFRGGCMREAVQIVCGADLPTLQSLFNKSLITRTAEDRYEMHELLRQYAEAKLEQAGEKDVARNAHCEYYADFMQERETDLKGRRQLAALYEIEADFENVRIAWNWAVHEENEDTVTRTLESLEIFAEHHDYWYECQDLYHYALEHFSPRADGASSLLWVHLLALTVDYADQDAKSQLEECLLIAKKYRGKKEIAHIMNHLANYYWKENNIDEAIRLSVEVLTHFQNLEDSFQEALQLSLIGFRYSYLGNYDEAINYFQHSIKLARETGNKLGMIDSYTASSTTAFLAGNYELTESRLLEALTILSQTNNKTGSAFCYGCLAWIEFMVKGDFARAREFSQHMLEITTELNHSYYQAIALVFMGGLACMENDYLQGRRLCDLGLSVGVHAFKSLANITVAIAECGLGNYLVAKQFFHAALLFAATAHSLGCMELYIPVAPIILAQENKKERAGELLGLVFSRSVSKTGWMSKWFLLTQLRANLEDELGTETYQAAWEQGKALDLETTVQNLLDEFDN